MYAAALLLAAAVAAPPSADAGWVASLPELLPPGTIIRDPKLWKDADRNASSVTVWAVSGDEAASLRREAASVAGRVDELLAQWQESDDPETKEAAGRSLSILDAADGLVQVLACNQGRLSYVGRHPVAFDPLTGARNERQQVVWHLPLARVVSVVESPARYAERTGTPLPAEPAGEPAADDVE